jgi:hypothetical protein
MRYERRREEWFSRFQLSTNDILVSLLDLRNNRTKVMYDYLIGTTAPNNRKRSLERTHRYYYGCLAAQGTAVISAMYLTDAFARPGRIPAK